MTDTETQTEVPEIAPEVVTPLFSDIKDAPEEEVIPPPPPKERKKRVTKYDTVQEYNRRYYHDVVKIKEKEICQYCKVAVVCRSSLLRHQRRSKHCELKRIAAELAELKNQNIQQ